MFFIVILQTKKLSLLQFMLHSLKL